MSDENAIITRLQDIQGDLTRVRVLLEGNGDPGKGLIVRVDRLEQSEARRKWVVGSAVGAAFASLFPWVLKMMSK